MSETAPTNSQEARTETGEIKPNLSTETATTSTESSSETKTTPAPDSKPEGDKSLLNEDKSKDSPLVGAPDKYSDFKAPEGYEFKPDTMEGAHTLFKELNLSQDGAQRLVDFHTAELKAALEGPIDAMNKLRADWRSQVKSDPVLGPQLDQVKATVARAIDGLGDSKLAADFREAMDFTGAGDHPAFIRAFYKMAQLLSEGRQVTGRGPSPLGQEPTSRPASAAKALYPNLPG